MRSLLVGIGVVASGCGFEPGRYSMMQVGDDDAAVGEDGGDGGEGGDGIDAFVAPPDGQECWSVPGVAVNVCLDDPLMGTATLMSNVTVDTAMIGTGAFDCKALRSGSTDVCAIVANKIDIQATRVLAAMGPKPLVLLATTVNVDGEIDVASHLRGRMGPGHAMGPCNAGTNPTDSGGGQGGSFGGKGGDGGNQDGESGSRGLAGAVQSNVTTLRGGCAGGHGGSTSYSHGEGGGALLIIADTLVVNGRINASGGGGEAGFAGDEGGGGGGSGGMIVLAAPTITLGANGVIFANGGHGGGGSNSSSNAADGTDPTGPASGGGGGGGSGNGGDGAPGYPSGSRNGQSASDNSDGGGGGGGGAGLIRVYSNSQVAGANVSPPAS